MDASQERVRNHARLLCEEIGPRLSGTPAAERAVEHIAQHMRKCGAEVEVQDFACPSWELESTELTLLGPDGEEALPALAQTFTGSCDVEAELVSVSTWNELEFAPGLDGKAIVLHGDAAPNIALDRNVTLLTSEERGVALIVVSPDETVSSKLTRDPRLGVPSIGVAQSVGRKLIKSAGRRVRLKIRARQFTATAHNVIGRLAGEQDGHVIIAAHHDTAAYSPGATDNASGTAALLELCEILAAEADRKVGIHFVTYGGHEYGRHKSNLGSVQYVRHHPDDVARALGILEGDVLGTVVSPPLVRVAGWPPRLKEGILAVLRRFARVGVDIRPETQPPRTGLGLTGVPSLGFTNNWSSIPIHTAQDTFDLLSPQELAFMTDVMAGVVRYLTSADGARVL